MSRIVYAEAGGIQATNTYRCCAERNVLDKWIRLAVKRGVAAHAIISWIRRKTGGTIVVKRYLFDNSLGCSVPCVFCRREIEKYDLVVTCTGRSGDKFEGRINDPEFPPSVLTLGQRRMLTTEHQRRVA